MEITKDTRVSTILETYGDTPLAQRLRSAWLKRNTNKLIAEMHHRRRLEWTPHFIYPYGNHPNHRREGDYYEIPFF